MGNKEVDLGDKSFKNQMVSKKYYGITCPHFKQDIFLSLVSHWFNLISLSTDPVAREWEFLVNIMKRNSKIYQIKPHKQSQASQTSRGLIKRKKENTIPKCGRGQA